MHSNRIYILCLISFCVFVDNSYSQNDYWKSFQEKYYDSSKLFVDFVYNVLEWKLLKNEKVTTNNLISTTISSTLQSTTISSTSTLLSSSTTSTISTTLSSIVTTQKPPICVHEGVLFDDFFNEIKKVCYTNLKLNYEAANNFCQANNMKLYAMTTDDEMNAILNYANEKFPKSNKKFWVRGEFKNGKWYLNPNELLMSNAIPNDLITIENCLSIADINNVFINKANQCDLLSDGVFCENILYPSK